MENKTRLDTGGRVVLDVFGNGAIILRPDNAHQRWLVNNTVVRVSSNTKEPQCFVYAGLPTSNQVLDSTYTGSNDASNSVYDIPYGQFLTVQWLGGDAGAVATVSVKGDLYQNVG